MCLGGLGPTCPPLVFTGCWLKDSSDRRNDVSKISTFLRAQDKTCLVIFRQSFVVLSQNVYSYVRKSEGLKHKKTKANKQVFFFFLLQGMLVCHIFLRRFFLAKDKFADKALFPTKKIASFETE
jgi:hypothetical protein